MNLCYTISKLVHFLRHSVDVFFLEHSICNACLLVSISALTVMKIGMKQQR